MCKKNIKAKRKFLWVGAGVSYLCPSNLPLGNGLTKKVLEISLGEELYDSFLESYCSSFSQLYPNDDKYEIPRLETVIQYLYDVQENVSNFEMIRFMEIFNNAPYNENHILMAYLLRNGYTIITSNFDMCIEKAYESIFNVSMEQKKNGKCIYSVDDLDNQIIHFHGVYSESESLGAWLNEIVDIDSSFAELLRVIFTEENEISFFGYSMSDSFDVNPILRELRKKEKKSVVKYYQYRGGEPNKNVFEILKESCSGSFIYEEGDNAYFLKRIIQSEGINATVATTSELFNWEYEISNRILLGNESTKHLIALYFEYQFGIRIKGVDIKEAKKVDTKKDFDKKLYSISVNNDIIRNYSNENYKHCRKQVKNIMNEAVKSIYENDIEWINRYSWETIKGVLCGDIFAIDVVEVNEIIKWAEIKMAEDPYIKNFKHRIILRRAIARLKLIEGKIDESIAEFKLCEKEYKEISLFDGCLSIKIDVLYAHLFLVCGKKDFFEVEKYFDEVRRMAKCSSLSSRKDNLYFAKKILSKKKILTSN